MSIQYIKNTDGPKLGFSSESNVKILEEDGKFFKDLSKDGKLDKYEDWRLSPAERAKDLASKMTIEQIAGLMLYSRHQSIPAEEGFFAGTYNGMPFKESGVDPAVLSDQQKEFLTQDHLRHVLITTVESPEVAAKWNNHAQALVEGIGLGIPINTSSDPRHSPISSAEYNAGAGGQISMWPDSLGLAATFDPDLVKKFGEIAAKEYRSLGITTALSPQIDLATDPRWMRFAGTFGEDPKLTTDLGRAYIDGFQTSAGESEIGDGWGYDSVNAMVKHWPGGGTGEGGRDAHWGYGKYAVYPGENFEEHLIPFTEGAFKLSDKTKRASAIMPYYTISYDQDNKNEENVGNSFNQYIINDLLRKKYSYDGVVCTDWMITANEPEEVDFFYGKPWGVEDLSVAQRHYKVLMAGVDQFGGNNEVAPILEAYQIGIEEHGENFMRQRFEESAVRLLINIFQLGLFENPYLIPEKSKEIVGSATFMEKGYDAQVKSMVLLKNKNNTLPMNRGKTVYIPKRHTAEGEDWFGNVIPEKTVYPINLDLVKSYYHVTDHPEKADFAIVVVSNPEGTGYDRNDKAAGGTGYVPISLQYKPYQAEYARKNSIGFDPREGFDRNYYNQSFTPPNTTDLDLILETKKLMKDKPVIVSIQLAKPAIMSEFESEVEGILANFGVQDQVILDIVSGVYEPSGLLPMQIPANMKTVEEQLEDVPHDMECHIDSEGNSYDFSYGLNWRGIIQDDRTKKYKIVHKDNIKKR